MCPSTTRTKAISSPGNCFMRSELQHNFASDFVCVRNSDHPVRYPQTDSEKQPSTSRKRVKPKRFCRIQRIPPGIRLRHLSGIPTIKKRKHRFSAEVRDDHSHLFRCGNAHTGQSWELLPCQPQLHQVLASPKSIHDSCPRLIES